MAQINSSERTLHAGKWRFTIPSTGYQIIPGGGHAEVECILDTVTARFYYPKMTESVRKWVKGCDTFLGHKSVEPRNRWSDVIN
jgi:hypothetical protein